MLKKFPKGIIMLSLLFASGFSLSSGVLFNSNTSALSGDTHISISPAIQEIELGAERTHTGTFTVENKGEEKVSYKIYSMPYQVSGEQYDISLDVENNYTKISKWITTSVSEGTLLAGEIKDIEFTINVPEDAPGGGQYAAIMVETESASTSQTVKVNNRVGMVVYGHVDGDVRKEGTVISHTTPDLIFDDNIGVTETVENSGNIDFWVSESMKVKSYFSGKILYDNSTKPSTYAVLPGTKRSSIQIWENTPKLGLFRVQSTLKTDIDEVEQVIEKVVFVTPSWFIVATIVFILAIVFGLSYSIKSYRKSKKNKHKKDQKAIE